jgi:adenine-specific DNA glycosylase
MGLKVEVKGSIGTFKQTFTHFKLTLHTFYCHATGNGKKGKWIATKNLDQLAMSRIHRRIAEMIDGEMRR